MLPTEHYLNTEYHWLIYSITLNFTILNEKVYIHNGVLGTIYQ